MVLDYLASAFAKVERSEAQVNNLHAEITNFFADNPYEVTSKLDLKRDEEIWSFSLTKSPTRNSW